MGPCLADLANAVDGADFPRLAAILVGFYSTAKRAPSDGPAYRGRIASNIASKRASLE